MSDLVCKLKWRGRRMLGLPIPPIITAVRKRRLTYLDEEALYDLHCLVSDIERGGRAGALIEAGCALGGSAIRDRRGKIAGASFLRVRCLWHDSFSDRERRR